MIIRVMTTKCWKQTKQVTTECKEFATEFDALMYQYELLRDFSSRLLSLRIRRERVDVVGDEVITKGEEFDIIRTTV